MKKLIINADGFGFTFGNNRAIFEVAKAGSITSISVNTNFPAVNDLKTFSDLFPNISIGVHLNPVVGKPVLDTKKIPSLLDTKSEFWGDLFPEKLRNGHIKLNELYDELTAQVEIVLNMGINVTHLDSHQNQHLRPGFFPTFLRIAKETGIRCMRTHRHYICAECENRRLEAAKYYISHVKTAALHIYTRSLMQKAKRRGMRMADRLLSVGHATGAKKTSINVWMRMFKNIPSGISEVYCHPAYPDNTLRMYADYVDERTKEREVLLSPQFKTLIVHSGVNLIGFNDI
ncbi:MAG: ChbG/HpnK family deacetylase [Candidatus Kuenenia sp.]|nr:ChbG/HpnK family deacetylase [Candidatus Kuenenia hertensis]